MVRVISEKLICNFPAFYKTRRYITVFTLDRQFSWGWDKMKPSYTLQPYFPKAYFRVITIYV